MKHNKSLIPLIAGMASVVGVLAAQAADWPMWGHSNSRNMVSEETGLVDSFDPGKFKGNTEEIDMATTKNVKWVAKLGSQAYGNPVVAGGRVYVGTNNEAKLDPKYVGDRGVLMCFDEKTGKLLWQFAVPKLGTGKISDWEYLGICSSPAVENDRVYLVTNRCEVICLDANGLANGNDGPFKDEAQYLAGPGKPPVTLGPLDADIIWRFDMREELGVFPHNITNCGPLIFGDRVVCTTSNGVDWNHTNIPNPKAPALCMLDKNTGKLIGEEASGVSSRTLHSNWSSASFGNDQVIFGGGDGWLYGFATTPIDKDGVQVFKELWKCDANRPDQRKDLSGNPRKYATPDGPSEVIATPVFYKGKVYVPIGQDPEHGEGNGRFLCIDPTKTGDISKSGVVWANEKMHRSLSTPAIYNDLVFVGDFSGYVHCFDANTGQEYWTYDTKSHIWSSCMVADGKVHVGTEDGDVLIFAADKTQKLINKIDMRSPVYATPVAANGNLFIATPTHLYCIGK